MKRTLEFSFRKQSFEAVADALQIPKSSISDSEFVAEKYELLDGATPKPNEVDSWDDAKYLKRKSFSVTIDLPDFIGELDLPAEDKEALAQVVEQQYFNFLKANYVTDFKEPVQPKWKDIRDFITSRKEVLEFTDTQKKQAAEDFGIFTAELYETPAVGEKLKAIAAAKFSKPSIVRHTSEFNVEIVQKLLNLVDQFVQYLDQNSPDKLEDYGNVCKYWSQTLTKYANQDKEVDLASVL